MCLNIVKRFEEMFFLEELFGILLRPISLALHLKCHYKKFISQMELIWILHFGNLGFNWRYNTHLLSQYSTANVDPVLDRAPPAVC